MARLGDYVKQIRGVSYQPADLHSSLDDNSVTLLRANNIQDGKLLFDDVVYVDKSRVKAEQLLCKGDILICTSSGSKGLVGKAAFVEQDFPATFGAFCKVVRPIKGNARYIGFFFDSPIYRKKIAEASAGVNINNIRGEHIDELEIRVVSNDDQEKAVAALGIIAALIDKRKKQLQKLDDLVKSRFVEMFGDPIRNTKNWQTIQLSDSCQRIFGGGTPSKSHLEFFQGTIPWVSPKDMKGDIIIDSIDHITNEAINNSSTSLVPAGSVLMVIRSGILKHDLPVAINSVPVTMNQDMKAFVPGDRITASYLLHYFKAIEADVLSGVRGVTADNIDFKVFQKRKIILPPLDLQNQFEEFCKHIDKSKRIIQQGLDKLDLLKQSLMQKYFG